MPPRVQRPAARALQERRLLGQNARTHWLAGDKREGFRLDDGGLGFYRFGLRKQRRDHEQTCRQTNDERVHDGKPHGNQLLSKRRGPAACVSSKKVSRSRMIACGSRTSVCVETPCIFFTAVPMAITSPKLPPIS